MITKFVLFLSLILVQGAHATVDDSTTFPQLRDDVVDMIHLSQKALADYHSVKDKVERQLPLNGAELNLIHEGVLSIKDPSDRLIE